MNTSNKINTGTLNSDILKSEWFSIDNVDIIDNVDNIDNIDKEFFLQSLKKRIEECENINQSILQTLENINKKLENLSKNEQEVKEQVKDIKEQVKDIKEQVKDIKEQVKDIKDIKDINKKLESLSKNEQEVREQVKDIHKKVINNESTCNVVRHENLKLINRILETEISLERTTNILLRKNISFPFTKISL